MTDFGTPPRRFKTPDEMNAGEHLEHRRSGDLPETDRYRQYVRDVHELAGLELPDDPPSKSAEDMTPDEHWHALRRH